MDELEKSQEIEISEEEMAETMEAVTQLLQHESPDVWGPHTMAYYGPSTRVINLTGDIDERLTASICSQIHQLADLDAKAPITVHINTSGGSVIDALAIYDTLQCVSNPIITIVAGGAFSAGIIIALAGDLRLATPNSMYFHHQPVISLANIDSSISMESSSQFYQWSKDRMAEIIKNRTNISEELWKRDFDTSTCKYFGTKEAIEYGIATDELAYAEKPEIILREKEEPEDEEEGEE